MRIVSIIMFVLLLLCIAVQYNDPDGWIWAAIYAYGAVVTWAAVRRKYTVWALVGFIGYTAGFFYWMPSEMVDHPSKLFLDLQMHEKGVEEVREDVGLLLCAVWMLVLTIVWWLGHNKATPPAAPSNAGEAGKVAQ